MGPEPSEVDCAIFGMMAMIVFNMPGSRYEIYIRGKSSLSVYNVINESDFFFGKLSKVNMLYLYYVRNESCILPQS
jgi:hypothetical protein